MNVKDRALLLSCAKLSSQIYEYLESVSKDIVTNTILTEHSIQGSDFEWIEIDETSTQAFLINTKETIFLVFLGSQFSKEGALDWFINGFFDLKPYNGGHAHSGFLFATQKSFQVIYPKIQILLEKNPQKQLVISGHSLGGAMALMYALELKNKGVEIGSLITFGQPRCGNLKFAKTLDFQFPYYRFENEDDMVPDLPPPYGKHNWSQAGMCFSSDDRGETRVIEVNKSVSDSWVNLIKFALLAICSIAKSFFKKEKVNFDEIAKYFEHTDHAMDTYLSRAQRYCESSE